MSVLQSVSRLEKFSELPSGEVERELAGFLVDSGGAARFDHVSATVGKRLQELVRRAAGAFEQRALEVEASVAGLASGVSVLLLGPPGTAKSAIARKISSLCGLGSDGRYFEYLLTSHTMPEEIFGGPKLEDLAKGRVVRAVEGKLPRAEIAFLDELFRGGSHILNTLLTILNEKRFDAGSGLEHVPLLGVIAAANTAPLEQDLEAIFDRFPVRVWLQSVLEPRSKFDQADKGAPSRLAAFAVAGEIARLAAAWRNGVAMERRPTEQVACTNDFRFVRAFLLRHVELRPEGSARFEQYERLYRAVRERCKLSDRTFGQLWMYGAALDFIRGKDPRQPYPVSDGHVILFRHVGRSWHDVPFLRDRVEQQTRGVQHTGTA